VITEGLKLTSYFGERQRAGGRFVADALLGLYGERQVATSILLRGAEGFGLKHRLRTDLSLSLSEDLPLTAIAVDRRERIEALAPEAVRLTGSGLVTLERARLLSGDLDAGAVTGNGATKLTIYLGRQERVSRVPAFVAVCDLLYRRGIDGATALLGVDGTAHGQRQRAAFFSRNTEVPMMVIAVGTEGRLARVLPELQARLTRPLITVERVVLAKRDGQLLARPPEPEPTPEPGPVQWQKLMVYTSEAARHDGQPIHRAIVRRLRSAGISGATTQLGIWGFHGAHAPHGDRLLQLTRHVPAVTSVVDTPARVAVAFGIIDELTTGSGLVTRETVPIRFRRGARQDT
jgi:PII-like signaling protein